jgi:hypothetical protein
LYHKFVDVIYLLSSIYELIGNFDSRLRTGKKSKRFISWLVCDDKVGSTLFKFHYALLLEPELQSSADSVRLGMRSAGAGPAIRVREY